MKKKVEERRKGAEEEDVGKGMGFKMEYTGSRKR
jgi:hypothetical protein